MAAMAHPQTIRKSSLSIALICTANCRIPASVSTNLGPQKGKLFFFFITLEAKIE